MYFVCVKYWSCFKQQKKDTHPFRSCPVKEPAVRSVERMDLAAALASGPGLHLIALRLLPAIKIIHMVWGRED